ncbi:hypothetical protein AGMMS49975_21630 [Clostridia bacterium]|nr:hypothetical protein AGMMS49975_21630 [Clostridia bacterium]
MIVYDRINFRSNSDILFDIELPGNRCMIGGNSSTGKSLFVNSLAFILDIQKSLPKPIPIKYPQLGKNIIIFNHKPADVKSICLLEKHLIIIDNADLYIADDIELAQHINCDVHNQYLIFSRTQSKLSTPLQFHGEFVVEGTTIRTKYHKKFGDWG